MARYTYASSRARWRSGRYDPMRRTSAVSMKSGSSSNTATDVTEAATAAHLPSRIGRTPLAIAMFAADRYALECCERLATFGISVSCSRLGRRDDSLRFGAHLGNPGGLCQIGALALLAPPAAALDVLHPPHGALKRVHTLR
uniref:Uncharacterized protein n=1 Tax=Zea mays TaxID=4577 RepID=A0A804LR37_MAIZE